MVYSTPEKLIENGEKIIEDILLRCDKLTSGNVAHNKGGLKMMVRHLKDHHFQLLREHLGMKKLK